MGELPKCGPPWYTQRCLRPLCPLWPAD